MEKNTVHENESFSTQKYAQTPHICPICHRGIDARFIYSYSPEPVSFEAQALFQCPIIDCRNLFIGYYTKHSGAYQLTRVAPSTFVNRSFSNEIEKLSPTFVEIYNEAHQAEQHGLSQVCGVGYRKALEFLIKDYAIYLHPDKEEEIKKEWLSKVINNYIDNPNIKLTAEKATWLGNDETHYVRIWDNMDINDLKTLIELTIRWIEMEEMTKGYSEKMNPEN